MQTAALKVPRRRLILHAGTPRTGTTALQISLQRHSDALLARGILYPPVDLKADRSPKHQWLVRALREPERASTIPEKLGGLLSGLSEDIHTIVLSTEGLFWHWWDFSVDGRDALQSLQDLVDVQVWVWFREPVAFSRSLYLQMLVNPQIAVAWNGRDVSFGEALDISWFQRQLDYVAYIQDVENLLGTGSVHPYAYQGNTVNHFFELIGVDIIDDERAVDHMTPGCLGVDILRRINRVPLDPSSKARAVELIFRLQEAVDQAPFEISDTDASRVEKMSAPSRRFLSQNYGITWSGTGTGTGTT